jgi:hypothetical protein
MLPAWMQLHRGMGTDSGKTMLVQSGVLSMARSHPFFAHLHSNLSPSTWFSSTSLGIWVAGDRLVSSCSFLASRGKEFFGVREARTPTAVMFTSVDVRPGRDGIAVPV